MKTSDLTGAALDWAVAKCEGVRFVSSPGFEGPGAWVGATRFSSSWAQGGPIIAREKITVGPARFHSAEFVAFSQTGNEWFGSSPLVAAMRCYVTSRLGTDVDVPDGILYLRMQDE